MAAEDDSLGGLLMAAIALAVAGAAMIRVFGWNYVKGWLATGWSTTQGQVEFGGVEQHRARYLNYYVARIDYSYALNDEYYSGYCERVFLRESLADRFVDQMKGQTILSAPIPLVRRNPPYASKISPAAGLLSTR